MVYSTSISNRLEKPLVRDIVFFSLTVLTANEMCCGGPKLARRASFRKGGPSTCLKGEFSERGVSQLARRVIAITSQKWWEIASRSLKCEKKISPPAGALRLGRPSAKRTNNVEWRQAKPKWRRDHKKIKGQVLKHKIPPWNFGGFPKKKNSGDPKPP